MSKTREAVRIWYEGGVKNIHQAAQVAGLKSSAPVYRLIKLIERSERFCPCCESILRKGRPFPKKRFKAVSRFLDDLEAREALTYQKEK